MSSLLEIERALDPVCKAHRLGDRQRMILALTLRDLTAPEPIAGLSRGETAMVRHLEALDGRTASTEALAAVADVTAESARQLMHGLRHKRTDLGARIRTVRGEGWRMLPPGPELAE